MSGYYESLDGMIKYLVKEQIDNNPYTAEYILNVTHKVLSMSCTYWEIAHNL